MDRMKDRALKGRPILLHGVFGCPVRCPRKSVAAYYRAPLNCGEHGGDPDSVKFFHCAGLNDAICSPFRVPVPRLAAAQAAKMK